MADVLFRSGSVVFDVSGNVVFTDDPTTCICCGGGGYSPVTCSNCISNGSANTAPGAVLVDITGSTCGINGSYVCTFFDVTTFHCRYRYVLPSPIATGAGDNFTSIEVYVAYGFGVGIGGQIRVEAVRDGIGSVQIRWRIMGSAFKECDTYSATNIPLDNNPLACTEGACAVTSL